MTILSDIRGASLDDTDPDVGDRDLTRYVRAVATLLGVPAHAYWCDATSPPAQAYLALIRRLPEFNNRDLALLWDSDHGWALAVESSSADDLVIVTYYGAELLPPPTSVRDFLAAALAGRHPGQADPPAFSHPCG